MPKEITLSWFGGKLFISLIIIMILHSGATIGVIIAAKTRIKKLEDRIVKLEALDDRATQIREQVKNY